MFHTFKSSENLKEPESLKEITRTRQIRGRRQSFREGGSRSTACTSCRRRKIKCDGEKPCEACRWYKKPDLCDYPGGQPPRRHMEKPSRFMNEYRNILNRLFPNIAPENLMHLSRTKLLELLPDEESRSSPQIDLTQSDAPLSMCEPSILSGVESLESLHTTPEELKQTLRAASSSIHLRDTLDDVNGLSLDARDRSSYLGVSSIQAALKVIAWLDSGFASYFTRNLLSDRSIPSHDSSNQPTLVPQPDSSGVTDTQALDAYFLRFQPFAPMLDERSFRSTFRSGQRNDSRWLALLNIVLALGSIAATNANDHAHQTYFQRCMSNLNLGSLGTAHLETVQALGLIGGWYCHYVSKPTLAYSLLGVSLRMAMSLGLHRENSEHHSAHGNARAFTIEIKRRVWWSLCCLEIWGSETLGRPGMGIFESSVKVNDPSYQTKENVLDVVPLIENVLFVKIATKIQALLAAVPPYKHQEILEADRELQAWWNNLPPILKEHETCPESLSAVRTVMRWRFHNQRMLLYRPMLLSYAMRRVPFNALRAEERNAICKCREIAEQSIHDIAMTSQMNQVLGWNAVWFIFQAAMVPLIGLYVKDATLDDPRGSRESCRGQIETTKLTLYRMQTFGHTARRSLDVISRIAESAEQNLDLLSSNMASVGSIERLNDFSKRPQEYNLEIEIQSKRTKTDVPLESQPSPTEEPSIESMWDYIGWSDDDIWSQLIGGESQEGAMDFLNMC